MLRRPPTDPSANLLEVDPAASGLLDLLVELGHLDDEMLGTVNDRLLDLGEPGGFIGVEQVRRIAAEVIFENESRLDPELVRVIGQDWGLIFS